MFTSFHFPGFHPILCWSSYDLALNFLGIPRYMLTQPCNICCLYGPRCCIRKRFLDTSGTICTAYSTLGSLEKEESVNAILLCIYMVCCFKQGVPIVLHENVLGFETTSMRDFAEEMGYEHVAFSTKPMDVGMHVGRPRKYLVFYIIKHVWPCVSANSCFRRYVCIYIYIFKYLVHTYRILWYV